MAFFHVMHFSGSCIFLGHTACKPYMPSRPKAYTVCRHFLLYQLAWLLVVQFIFLQLLYNKQKKNTVRRGGALAATL
jgi:hypothetical protein